MSLLTTKTWNRLSKFYSGDTLLRDEPRSGCSSNLSQDALREFVGKQSIKKYLRISTWSQYIAKHNLPPLEKDRKNEHENLLRKYLHSIIEFGFTWIYGISTLMGYKMPNPFLYI